MYAHSAIARRATEIDPMASHTLHRPVLNGHANPETKNIRVLVVTGLHGNTEAVRKVKRMGIEGFMTKPVDLELFADAIASLCAQPA